MYMITIKILTCSYIKKSLKKCLCCFNKTFSNYQLIRRNSICSSKNQAIFLQTVHRERLNPSPPLALFVFICSLRISFSPSTVNPLLKRVRWKR